MVSCVPGAMVAIARKCKPLDPSEAVWRTTTQFASPGSARFFTNSLPTYVWKRVSPVVASRKTWVIWNCVHQAKKHLRGPMMV